MDQKVDNSAEKSCSNESSTCPEHSRISYECDNSVTDKSVAKPTGAYNASTYTAKNAASVFSKENFALANVDFKTHHNSRSELKERPFLFVALPQQGQREAMNYHVMAAAGQGVVHGDQDVSTSNSECYLASEQYELHGSIPDIDQSTDVILGVRSMDYNHIMYCVRCSQQVDDSSHDTQQCPNCMGPISIRYIRR